MMQVNVLF